MDLTIPRNSYDYPYKVNSHRLATAVLVFKYVAVYRLSGSGNSNGINPQAGDLRR